MAFHSLFHQGGFTDTNTIGRNANEAAPKVMGKIVHVTQVTITGTTILLPYL